MLSSGQKVTLLRIDDALAMTHRYELEVRAALAPQAVGYQGRDERVAIVRQRRKRRDFHLDLKADDILLDGWDVPFKVDTECDGVIAGNACFNLVGEPEAIRTCLEAKTLRPLSDDAKAKILVTANPRTKCDGEGVILLYPDIATDHAVVNRMKCA